MKTIAATIVYIFAAAVFAQADRPKRPDPSARMKQMFQRYDKNKDGVLDKKEMPSFVKQRLDRMDGNKDGKVSMEEMQKARSRRGGSSSKRPGEVITPAAKGERQDDKLKVGDDAPDFTLSDPHGKRKVTLSDFEGKRPVILIFGSYT